MPFLGAHMSIAGGLHRAFDRIRQVEGEALQIFTKNQRQWQSTPISDQEAAAFNKQRQRWGPFPVASHDSYLINLATHEEELAQKSIIAFADELCRAAKLAIPFVIMHPGAHMGKGIKASLRQFTTNLNAAMALADDAQQITVLIETTAGQGSGLGSTFEEVAFIIEHSRYPERLGVCVDTCHLFAAGYDFRTPQTYRKTFSHFDRVIGLDKLKFFHLNDSKKGQGSKVDRHEHIGKGEIGLAGFKLLVNDPRFKNHPMTLETPKGKDLAEDIENLSVLRKLLDR